MEPWTNRNVAQVRGPKARQMLTLELDADSPKEAVFVFLGKGSCGVVLGEFDQVSLWLIIN